ncbi:MAG: alpha/beta hydrolase [Myxococcales bacterium]|nr:alpha/beta hydrolase [Myxococcota bacterium]MDW8284083.1 alpha/beta hydrolase [Myxococcales bacterium]
MSLHPELRALLDQLAALSSPPLESLPPQEARRRYRGFRVLAGRPDASVQTRELSMPGADGPLPARLYRVEESAAAPVLLYLHGGGWVVGGLDTHDGLCRGLARASRCAVVSLDYRLAPEHRFPAALEDAWAALVHLGAHGATLGLDAGRLGIGGDSAGGNLAAAATMLARDRGGPRLRAQLLLYPAMAHERNLPSHHEFARGYLLTASLMDWFWQQYLRGPEDAHNPLVSPLKAEDLRGLPPALVVTAELDPLRDEGEAYAARLAAAGVPTVLRRYRGMIHGFLQMTGVVPAARQALDEIGGELGHLLAG